MPPQSFDKVHHILVYFSQNFKNTIRRGVIKMKHKTLEMNLFGNNKDKEDNVR